MTRFAREPLLHFLLIGVVVFVASGQRPPIDPEARRVIEIRPAGIERLAQRFEAVWRRPPTADEREHLIDEFVREEVYYREALALGLDRDDTVIRRRLRQKMEFLGDAGAGARVPEEAELREYFAARLPQFTAPARVTFQQVPLGGADPAEALAALTAGEDPAEIGRGALLPATMEAAVSNAVDGTFGNGFFAVVAALPTGDWQGPVASAYGPHLVRLIEFEPATAPPFEQVREQVEAVWRQQAAEELRADQYQAMQARYEIVLPEGVAE